MSDDAAGHEPGIEQTEQRYNVKGGHQLRPSKHTESEFGPVATEWTCVGCGGTWDHRPSSQCPDPTEWVLRGAPGDGLGWCPDCDSLFQFEYSEFESMVTAECPSCGSHRWKRSDDGRPDNAEVV